ncbi:MAG TPA: restriction endonuclease [Chthoniobacterales bacterium]|nr:restriction endonuclease [Chthoniobacterales bacterium]
MAPIPYAVAIGKATGGLFFDQTYYDKDRANQRSVAFPRKEDGRVICIPRSSFSEAFQRRLRVQGMTVNDLGEFGDEIQAALTSIEKGTDHSWVNQLHEEIGRQQSEFKRKLLTNIQSGKTNLRTGGIGLENLICELLTIEGYKARVFSKRHFGSFADADVQASRSDRCASVHLLLQVKHHQGFSDAHGIDQLKEIQKAHEEEYDDHQRVFVTSASVSEEVLKAALEADITVIGGLELADWISEHIEKLSKETKLMLGIYEVPAVV